jgi:hypothetical protein
MAGLDEVMERLFADKEFRASLATDPDGALAGYSLSEDDREVLGATLTDDAGTSGVVEQRTTQSSVAGLLSAFDGILGPADSSSGRVSVGADGNPDKAATFTAIAMAESGGDTSRN